MFLTSLRNWAHDFAGVDLCCWTRSKAAVEAVWRSVWWGPRICGFSLSAELAKTWPTGALLKNGFLKFWTGALFSSAVWLGRLPVFLKTYASRGRRGQELDQVSGLVLMGSLLRDGEERAAPVAARAGRGGDVPLALRRRGLTLDVAHHPRGAGHGRELALLVAGVPVGAERGQPGGFAGQHARHGQVVRSLDARVRRRDVLAGGVVVGRVELADHRVVDVRARVEEERALRGLGLVALARVDVGLPRRPQLRDGHAVGREACLREQVLAVADREAAHVRAEADHGPALADRLLVLPGQPAALDRVCTVLAQVDQVLRLGGVQRNGADLDRLDVGRTCAGREVLRELGVVIRVALDLLLDRHARVRGLVLLVEVVVPEVAEQADP